MASAKFLEEALSTDVDESAVNAIVGSLETQLVTSTPILTIQQPTTVVISQNNNQLNSVISNGGNIPIVHGTIQKQHGVANGGNNTNNSLINQSTINNKPIIATTSSNLNQLPPPPTPPPPTTTTTTPPTTTTNLLPINIVTSSSSSSSPSPSTVGVVLAGSSVVQSSSVSHLNPQQQINQSTQEQIPTYINQVTTNQITNNQQQNIITSKNNDTVKLVYPSTGQVLSTSGIININNKLQFTNQNIGQLGNGGLGVVVTTQASVLQQSTTTTTSNVVTSVVGNIITTQSIGNVNKLSSGTTATTSSSAIMLKTSGIQGGMVPMSVPVSVAGVNTVNTTLQGKTVGGVIGTGTSTIVPSNVQILNVNTMRPGTPITGQQTGKQVTPRVILGQHVLNARPGTPGITLQALHGFQSGTQGHLIVKTENGQLQLLRVGLPPTSTPGGTAVTTNTIGGNTVVAQNTGGTTTYRLASVPGVSRLNAQFTGPPLTTIRKPVQTVAPIVATTTVTSTTATAAAAPATVTPPTTTTQAPQTPTQRPTTENTKEKCRKFLANLLELSSREPKAVERNVRTLIQELIDTKVEPEEFCDRLEKLLNASPQPCLIGFLKKSLPLLRQSLVTRELVIEGIRPPPPNVVFSVATTPTVQQNQVRATVAVPAASAPYVVPSSQLQARIMAPPIVTAAGPVVAAAPRGPQIVHQRLIRPTTIVKAPTPYTVKSTISTTNVRPPVPTVQKSSITTTTTVTTTIPVIKTTTITTTSAQGKTANTTTTINKTIVPSAVPKPTAKEKEKKTFSSAGYTGDDDINDVAAMGGVNLAEESQRILGSTEFVGTQIRSCKDEVFLHASPLQQKIKQIVSSHGLEEPNFEVAAIISHATQERLKNLVEKLAVIAEHRVDLNLHLNLNPKKPDDRYEVTQDVRAQLKFLEKLDDVERKRHDDQEREMLLRAAKSRSKNEDPEQAKLKAKAKEMQRAEMEELRQREANTTALQAIGQRKKIKLDDNTSGTSGTNSTSGVNRPLSRPRIKRVNFRDLLFLLEQEKETSRSTMLYKAYLK